ncbi:MAG TPA: hypothetical protein VGB17_06980 [Pyrinomonadaceae bacterium]|jgi:hypothetical protein
MKNLITIFITIFAFIIMLSAGARAQTPGTSQYPTGLDTTTTLPQLADLKSTYLTAAINASVTTITVASTSGFPSAGVAWIQNELFAYTGTTATTFTGVTRGLGGTTATTHALRETVMSRISGAGHVNAVGDAARELEKKVGIGASNAASASTGYVLTKQSDGTTSWQAAAAGESPLTFSSPLSRSVNTVSIIQSDSTHNGYLSSVDWSTFNSKQAALSVTNDTNVTGSVAGGVLTLGWTSTLAKSRQHAATVYTDQANTFAFLQSFQAGNKFELKDPTDTTKKFQFDASSIATGTTRTVNIPDANSTTAQTKSATTNQFLTSMSAQGVFSAAQVAFSNLSGSVAASQMPALTGDVTSTAGTVATTLASVGTAGTYRSVTTDAKGRVTAGTNPTTFSGYGLSDTSANLRDTLTDESGTGAALFQNGNIGNATGTTLDLTGVAKTAVTFQNSWVNTGGGYANATYQKSAGIVCLQGLIQGGAAGSTVFTLPSGYYGSAMIFYTQSQGGPARIDIGTNGAGQVSVSSYSGTWVSISGLCFVP